jgi:hypothetical protein
VYASLFAVVHHTPQLANIASIGVWVHCCYRVFDGLDRHLAILLAYLPWMRSFLETLGSERCFRRSSQGQRHQSHEISRLAACMLGRGLLDAVGTVLFHPTTMYSSID